MANIDSNKLMGLLITAGGGLLLSQEYIKQRRKRQNDRLMRKEDFRKNLGANTFILHITNLQKTIGSHSCTYSI